MLRPGSQLSDTDSFLDTIRVGSREVLLVLKAYFDETGIHEGSRFCVVAGYFGGEKRWRDLSNAWGKTLLKYEVHEFHARRFFGRDDFGNRLDEYKDWTDDKAKAFINALVSAVEASKKINPISCSLVKEAWNELSYGERRYISGGMYSAGKFKTSGAPSKAYFLPFQYCIVNTAHYCGVGQRVHFIFDLNEQFKGFAHDLYALLRGEHSKISVKDRLGPLTFETSLHAVPIQVSDLFNYLTAKWCEWNIEKRSSPFPHAGLLGKLVENTRHTESHKLLDRNGLAELLEQLPADMRKHLKAAKQHTSKRRLK